MVDNRPSKRRRIAGQPEATSRFSSQTVVRFLTTPDAPIIFGSYARAFFHGIGTALLLYVLYSVLHAFTSGIQDRYRFEVEQLAEEARVCHQNYIDHNCGPDIKGAIWQSYCEEWDRCRIFQPHLVGKTKVAAQVFAELMNGFVEPLSLKAMLTICLLVFSFFIISSLSRL